MQSDAARATNRLEHGTPRAPAGSRSSATVRRPNLSSFRRRQLTGWLFVAPAVLLVTVLFVVPLGLMAWMSLNDWGLVGAARFIGLDNYARLLGDAHFLSALVFSLRFAVLIVPVIMLAGLGLGALVASRRRGVVIFRATYFLPLVIGFAAASYLWLWLFNGQIGLVNKVLSDFGLASSTLQWLADPTLAFVAAATLVIWKTVGFSMILFMGGLQSVPQELRDAAAIDGASRWQTFRRVTLPLMKNTTALVFVFAAISCLLVFEPFFILTRGGPGTSTVGVVQWIFGTSFYNFQLGYGAAASVMLLVILLALTSIQLRAFLRD
jgi:multiple sugar transport system permease protein